MANLTVDVGAWLEINRLGACVPASFQVVTGSMKPLIRPMLDTVTVMPAAGLPQKGDIVLFRRKNAKTGETEYCLHRVYEINGDTVVTRGDNCLYKDSPVPRDGIVGIAVRVKRGKRDIRLDTDKGRRALAVKRASARLLLRLGRRVGILKSGLRKLIKQ